MQEDDRNDADEADDVSNKDTDSDALPWEDSLILAFRDMQWEHKLTSMMAGLAPEQSVVAGALEALRIYGPGAIHKLDDGAERLGDVIASNGAGPDARFFLFEFKSGRSKRPTEYAKPMLIGAVGRLVLQQDAEMIASGDRCHFAVFANSSGLAEPADLDEEGEADEAGDPPQQQYIDTYEQRELIAEPYFDWVRQGVRSVLRELEPGQTDRVDSNIRAAWEQRKGDTVLEALEQFEPAENNKLDKLAEVIWGGAGLGLLRSDYMAYIRWLAGVAGGGGEQTKVKLVAVSDGQLYYCLTTIGKLALRFQPPSPTLGNKIRR